MIGGRGTVADESGVDFIARDLSANVHVLLLEDESWWPAVAAGMQDIGGGLRFLESPYVVASKTLFDRVRGTAGYGFGPDTLDGVFAGLEVAVNNWLTVLAEYDADDLNTGLRLFPMPEFLEEYGLPRPSVDLVLQDGDDFAAAVNFRVTLGESKYRAQRKKREHFRYERALSEPVQTVAASVRPPLDFSTARASDRPGRRRAGDSLRSERVDQAAPLVLAAAALGTHLSVGQDEGLLNRPYPSDFAGNPTRGLTKSAYQREVSFDTATLQTSSEAIARALVGRGFENVRVSIVPTKTPSEGLAPAQSTRTTIVVEYENRRYNRDELDGLGVVLGVTATRAPAAVDDMRIITKEVQLPVLEFACAVDDFVAYLNTQLSGKELAGKAHISNHVRRAPSDAIGTDVEEPSWLKLDIFLRPSVETLILTNLSAAEGRFGVRPDAVVQLTPGAVVNVRVDVPLGQTDEFPGDLPDPEIDRVLGHQALTLPFGPWSEHVSGITQFSGGKYLDDVYGISNETALTLLDGWFLLKGTAGLVGDGFSDLDRKVLLAEARVRYPDWDVSLGVTGGQFLEGERGVAVDLRRFFGNTEIGVFLRYTDEESIAGLRLGIPLTPPQELKPYRVRPRLPEVFSYEQQTQVFESHNQIVTDVALPLATDHGIDRVYWNRDRLYPTYVRRHLDTLREAVRRWVEP